MWSRPFTSLPLNHAKTKDEQASKNRTSKSPSLLDAVEIISPVGVDQNLSDPVATMDNWERQSILVDRQFQLTPEVGHSQNCI
jgi:hypothetical protein